MTDSALTDPDASRGRGSSSATACFLHGPHRDEVAITRDGHELRAQLRRYGLPEPPDLAQDRRLLDSTLVELGRVM